MMSLLAQDNPFAIQHQGFLALALAGVVLSVALISKVGLPSSLLFLLSVLNGCYIGCYGISPYQFNLGRYYIFSNNCLRAIAMVLSVGFILSNWSNKILSAIMAISVFNALLLLVWNCGIFYCPSIDASFCAATLPLFFRGNKWINAMVPLISVAVLKTGSSASFLGLFLSVVLYFRSFATLMVYGLLAIIIYPFMYHTHALLYSNGRAELWKAAWEFFRWHDQWYWFGSGLGTYAFFEPEFRSVNGVYQRWLYLHNDFGEIGFTLGGIGLVLALFIFGFSLWKSRHVDWLFSSIATFGFCIMTQPMIHNFMGLLFAGVLAKEAHKLQCVTNFRNI